MGLMKDILKPQIRVIDLRKEAEKLKSFDTQYFPDDEAPYIEYIKTDNGTERRWVRPRPTANTGSRRGMGSGKLEISSPFPCPSQPPPPPEYLAPPEKSATVPAAPTGDTKYVVLAPVKAIDASTETEDCKCPYVVKSPGKPQPQVSKKNKKGKKDSPTTQVASEESEDSNESEDSGSEVPKQPKGKHSKAQRKAETKQNTSNNAKNKKEADTKTSEKKQVKKQKSSLKALSKSIHKCNCAKRIADDSSIASASDESDIDDDSPAKKVHTPQSGHVNWLKEPERSKFIALYEKYLKHKYEDDFRQLSAMKAADEDSFRKGLAAKEADQEAAWKWFRRNQQTLENTAVHWVQERDTARKEENATAPSYDDIEASARRADVQRANEWIEERVHERGKTVEKQDPDENPGSALNSRDSDKLDDGASTSRRRKGSVSKTSSRSSKDCDTRSRRQPKHVSFAREASVRYPSSSDSDTTTSSSSEDTPSYQRLRRASKGAVDIDINYEPSRKRRSRHEPVYVIRPKGRKYTVNGREAVVVTKPGSRKAEEERDGYKMSGALQNQSSMQNSGNTDDSRQSWGPATSFDGPSGSNNENRQNGNRSSNENYGRAAPNTATNPSNSGWNNNGYPLNQNMGPATTLNNSRVSSWNDGGANTWQPPTSPGWSSSSSSKNAGDGSGGMIYSGNRQYDSPYWGNDQEKPNEPNDPYANVEW